MKMCKINQLKIYVGISNNAVDVLKRKFAYVKLNIQKRLSLLVKQCDT